MYSIGNIFGSYTRRITIFYYGIYDFENKSALSSIENNVRRVLTQENYTSSTFCGFSVYKVLGTNLTCLFKQITLSNIKQYFKLLTIRDSLINIFITFGV